jgi:hypothetical protein
MARKLLDEEGKVIEKHAIIIPSLHLACRCAEGYLKAHQPEAKSE